LIQINFAANASDSVSLAAQDSIVRPLSEQRTVKGAIGPGKADFLDAR
jgi:hypothetical protein